MIQRDSAKKKAKRSTNSVQPLAVIDIGASSIRMEIAEFKPDGSQHHLERLIQGVSVGKDTFTRGVIRKQTIEDCVRVLRSYRAKLDEYHVHREEHIRVVATSAVREATNRLAFIDRVYSATGFRVEIIEDAEISRVVYLGILPMIREAGLNAGAHTIVTEVGGGSTDVLLLADADVVHSKTYRLGSLRLRETLENYQAARSNARHIMESEIDRTIEQLREFVTPEIPVQVLALGGDIRFAASQIENGAKKSALRKLPVNDLERFTEEMLQLTEDQIIQRYHLTLPDAETLGPALLTYVRMAREFRIPEILVAEFNLRGALLKELSASEGWLHDFREQTFRSALKLAARYDADITHSRHVARLAQKLFNQLHYEHSLDSRWETILLVAAVLHEVGLFISNKSYHKHTMYIISNSEVFGLGSSDLELVSLVARYHRRASPKSSHPGYGSLQRDERIAVSQMAAILRVAASLDYSRSQRISDLTLKEESDRFVVDVPGVQDLSLEQLELKQNGNLFEEIFGKRIMLRSGA